MESSVVMVQMCGEHAGKGHGVIVQYVKNLWQDNERRMLVLA